MSFVGSNILAGASGQGGAGGYEIERSLRFNAADTAYLERNLTSVGDQRVMTFSFWVKKNNPSSSGELAIVAMDYNTSGSAVTNRSLSMYFGANTLKLYDYGASDQAGDQGSSVPWYPGSVENGRLFRDPSAWYHVVFAIDTTQSTAANRCKVWINGEQGTHSSQPTQNTYLSWGQVRKHYIGIQKVNGSFTRKADLQLADFQFIEGQALAATDFGETDDNGVWQPKEFDGTYSAAASGTTTALSQTGWLTSGGNSEGSIWDGSTSTQANGHNAGVIGAVSFNPPLTNVTKVELYTQNYHHYLNGSQITTAESSTGWHTYYDNSGSPITLNSVGNSYTNNTQTVDLMAIRINGTIINSQNWTPPSGVGLQGTGENSFHLDFKDNSTSAALGTDTSGNSNTWTVHNLTAVVAKESANWPAMTTGSPYNSSHSIDRAFDGSDSTGAAASAGTAFVFTPSTAITGISKVRIRAKRDASQVDEHDFKLNGTNIGGSWSLNSTATVEFTVNNLTSLLWATKSNGQWYEVFKIEIFYDGSYKTLITNASGPASIDALRDSPSQIANPTDTGAGGEVVGNYCTWNPVQPTFATTSFSNGNLDCSLEFTNGSATPYAVGTFAMSSGKWYWEITITQESNDTEYIGIISGSKASGAWAFADIGAYFSDARKAIGAFPSSYGTSYTTGDVIGIALDADNGNLTFYKNGVSQGAAATGMTAFNGYKPFISSNGSSTAQLTTANFGQRAFVHAAPTNFKSLNTANLPTPTIADGSQYFDTKLYTGNSGTTSVNYAFSPDFVWIKGRSEVLTHRLVDTIRGGNKQLNSNTTNAEYNFNGVTFQSDGFDVTNDIYEQNKSGTSYAAWAWDGGTYNTTIAAGSLNSSLYDQSAIWSGMCSPSPTFNSLSNGFDGNLATTFYDGVSAGAYFTFTPTGGYSFNSQIRVYNGGVSDTSVKINGGTSISLSTNSWTTVATGSGTLTTLAITRGVTQVHGWFAIEIDGKVLVDSNITLANVPSIASTVRANPSAGFSIVSFTPVDNSSIGHSLNASPELIIYKNRDSSQNWRVYHKSLDSSKTLYLNTNDGETTDTDRVTAVTSTAFTVGNIIDNQDHIAYCFAPVKGYSAMGSYTGNGSADGPFVYTGFKPAFILIKASSINNEDWVILDTSRASSNVSNLLIKPNTSEQEFTNSAYNTDILSNGFKIRNNNPRFNQSGATYIYYVTAENPFKTARAR